VCPVTPLHLTVDEKGYTRPTPGEPNVQVCLHSDAETFFKFYMPRVLGG
jgi:purine nucleosidase